MVNALSSAPGVAQVKEAVLVSPGVSLGSDGIAISATLVFGGVFSSIVFDDRLISCGAIPQSRVSLKVQPNPTKKSCSAVAAQYLRPAEEGL